MKKLLLPLFLLIKYFFQTVLQSHIGVFFFWFSFFSFFPPHILTTDLIVCHVRLVYNKNT